MSRFLLFVGLPGEVPPRLPSGWKKIENACLSRGALVLGISSGGSTGRTPGIRIQIGGANVDPHLSGVDIGVEVDASLNQVRLVRPLTATRSIFWRVENGRLLASDDPRIIRGRAAPADARALAGLLAFGAIFAPRAPWKDLRQVRPGTEAVVECSSLGVSERKLPWWSPLEPRGVLDSAEHRRSRVAKLIEEVVQGMTTAGSSLVLFSGGVDSALIALAARNAVDREMLLFNCSMGPGDAEAAHAARVASALRMPLAVVQYEPEKVLGSFADLLAEYPVPFSDYSVLPTWWLARAAASRLGRHGVALDGTAADATFGQFGGFQRWTAWYRVPAVLRRGAAEVYSVLRLYQQEGRLERLLRKAQRTRRLTMMVANLMVHPMAGIGLHIPEEELLGLEADMLGWAEAVLPQDAEVRFCLLDVVHQCCGVLAQKDEAVFESAGCLARYPFLDPRMVRLAMEEARTWPGRLEPKAILKEILAEEIGRELVYRPKSGFVIPQQETFGSARWLDLCDEMLSSRSCSFSSWIDRDVVRSLLVRVRRKERLALYSYSFLWAMVFAFHWYRQAETVEPVA